MKPRKTKGDLDRRDVIVAYLRDLGRALKLEREGKAVLVYTDESYVHQNHCPSNSWVSVGVDGNIVDRGTSKGRRLIILHAITRDGPLVTYEGQGPARKPIETLVWKPPGASATAAETDTPHPIDTDGEALTAELLWVAQSHTGDYHDNMDSDSYQRWVKNRLLPTFAKRYPGKQMILIQDNVRAHRSSFALTTVSSRRRAAGAVPPQAGDRLAHVDHEEGDPVRHGPSEVPRDQGDQAAGGGGQEGVRAHRAVRREAEGERVEVQAGDRERRRAARRDSARPAGAAEPEG